MKKLLILLSVAFMLMAVKAASIDWSLAKNSWTLQNGESAGVGYTVYLTLSSSQDNLISALKGGATSFTTSTAGILAVGQTTGKKGVVAESTATSTSLTPLTYADYAILLIDTTSVSGKTYYNFSASQSERAYDETDSSAVKFAVAFDSTSFEAGSGTTGWTAVPEPTSGLIMLLGMAGLALKRKRV